MTREDGGKKSLAEGEKRTVGWMLVILVYVSIVAALLMWCISFDSKQLRDQLISIIPWFLEVNLLLIIIAIGLSFAVVRNQLKDISSRQWCLVSAIVVLGVVMTAFVAPRTHRLFYDENIYLNIGQTIAAEKKAAMCAEGYNRYGEYHCAQLEHNKQPYAFPHLISIVYRVFGPSETVGFVFNNVVFGLAILLSFLLGFLLFGHFAAGIYSALIYCLIPENVIWANTTAVEPSAALFSGLVMAAGLIYLKEKGARALFLLSVLLPYSMQFRTESFLIVPVVGFLVLLHEREALRDWDTYILLAISFVLIAPHIVQLYAVRGESWGSSGLRMSLAYLFNNFRVNSLFYINNVKFPFLYTLLLGVGLLLKGTVRKKLFLVTWLFLFWGIFLFFYAGSYEFGQDVRFSLVSYMPLSVLAGLGIFRLERLLEPKGLTKTFRIVVVAVLCLSFTSFLPHVRTIGEEACQARADHKYAREMAKLLPEDSMVLTHNPNMFLLWGKNAAQASIATHNAPLIEHFFKRYTGGVYFHFNYWCNTDNARERAFCQNILDKYGHEAVANYEEGGYTFALYRLKGRSVPTQEKAEEKDVTDELATPKL
ncbi:MAG: glycosyltransferase family 39 protein [Thermodesulfobacteriota bacterium]|nr:glycosyltransferase family 39 protein [Thermodesulfobacteriota bacterium]